METADLPDNTLILDSLIHSVLVINQEFIICYANHAALQLLAQSRRKLFETPFSALFSYSSFDEQLMRETLANRQSFTDNEVILVINNQ